jgi:chloride channel protein, CIC family
MPSIASAPASWAERDKIGTRKADAKGAGRSVVHWRLRRAVPGPERRIALRHRVQRVVVLAAVTGAATGLAVVVFETLTVDVVLDRVRELPNSVIVVIPAVGLTLAWVALRWIGLGASPSVADEYAREYHGRSGRSDARAVAGRLFASVATLGSGGAMGFEGPSIYIGATIGGRLQQRYRRFFTSYDTHVLLVAGAAAGVAAIFKAPATGAVFALEAPYQQDTAAHAVLPALVGAATSYLTYVAFKGTSPLLHIVGNPAFDARDLLGAIGLGLLCAIGARGFARLATRAKGFQRRSPAWLHIFVGGAGLLVLAAVAVIVFGEPLTIGPGYQAISWSLSGDRSAALVALLFVLEATATLLTVAGGGAGGLFIPLVVQGWLLGGVIEALATTGTSLFPVVGAAAYLGAGYRTPIAAVVFVAEATRGPGYIVPALVATAVSQLLMGSASVSTYQIQRRVDPLTRRLARTVTSAMTAPRLVCSVATTLDELSERLSRDEVGVALVLDGDHFVGTVSPRDLLATSRAAWPTTTAGAVTRKDQTTTTAECTLGQARALLAASSTDSVVVLDEAGHPIGVVTARSISEQLGGDEDT